jgi:hypothetical protein
MTTPTPLPVPEPVPPTPAHRAATAWRIELKVIASTAATFAVSIVLAVLNAVENNHDLLGSTPSVLQTILIIIVPTIATFLSGYMARHTSRGPTSS